MADMIINRLMLHNKMMEVKDEAFALKKRLVTNYLIRKLHLEGFKAGQSALVEYLRLNFFGRYSRKWELSRRYNDRFIRQNSDWLNEAIHFPGIVLQNLPSTSVTPDTRGRPEIDFHHSSERSKRRKTENIRSSYSAAKLSFATRMKLRDEGDEAAAKLLTEVTTTTPTRASRVLSRWRKTDHVQTELSGEEALSLIIYSELTKNQYKILRETARNHGHRLYPSYETVRNAKYATYPDGIRVTEDVCEVNLQELLLHTASRIVASVSTVPSSKKKINATLICKYGFDGSSGHSQYKQVWETGEKSDEFLFMSSMVPLRLLNDSSGEVIWENPRPSSPRFCRPIRLQWTKETKDIIKAEESTLRQEIENFKPVNVGNHRIKFCLLLTMINGKVCNALTESTGLKCYICGAKISEMNDLPAITNRNVDEENLSFGISTLHCYIRFFECLLHISYRLVFKQWQARGNNKLLLKKRKSHIQKVFRKKMGLIVDVPKPGYGSTNDGNTSRRFFESPRLSAEITGIDEDLIKRFANILKAISSGFPLNEIAFKDYCCATAEMYVRLYPWYHMPPTVHKVLIHGAEIAKEAILPLGQLTEEAMEARNKDARKYRERYTRKHSRVATNEDLFRRLLLTSDPLISISAPVRATKGSRNMSKEIKRLLVMNNEEELAYGDEDSSDEECI